MEKLKNQKFKRTLDGKIPRDWKMVSILDYCDFEKGTEPGSKFYNRERKGIPFIRVGNIAAKIQEQIYTTSKNIKLCDEEDVLLTLDGSPGIVVKGFRGAYSSGIRKIIVKKPHALLRDFIYFILQADFIQKTIEKYTTGVTIKHASKSLEHIKIPLPPFSVQQKIVYVLDCVQAAVGAQEKIIEKTKELKQAMMAKLFREGTRGEKLKKTEIGKIPESWDIVEFEKTLDSEVNYEVGELKQKDFQATGQFPIIDQSEALIAGYSDDGEKVYNGKLPIIIFGDHTRVVKYVDFPFIIGGSGVKILIPNKEFDILFLFYAINNLNLPSRGYSRHFKVLKEKFIPKPELSEQCEIANILQTIDQKIEIEQKKKALYEELFRSMLNKIMSGEIKVDNLNLKYVAKN